MWKRFGAVLLALTLAVGLALPALATAPTEETTPAAPATAPKLELDTKHVYADMDTPYEDGYLPKTENGTVYLVLPLLCDGALKDSRLKASLELGSGGLPFVAANYEKIFPLESVKPQGGGDAVSLYLIRFAVKLTADWINGVYPVTVRVSGADTAGNPVSGDFTLYVTVSDGASGQPETPEPEKPTAEPVVYIARSTCLPAAAMAGEPFTLTLVLRNSLDTKSVRNLMVQVDTGNLQLNLQEDSNVFQAEDLDAGGETVLTLHFQADPSIPAGKYPVNLTFRYDSSETLNLSSSGSVVAEIRQPANLELVTPSFPEQVTVGETIPLSLQVMNMGRDAVYNVRCTLSGPGFAPAGTGYIGTMTAGSSSMTKIDVFIIALNANAGNTAGESYGDTAGTLTLLYEDADGQEYRQELTLETSVARAVTQIPEADPAEQTRQNRNIWWITVLILGGGLVAAGIVVLVVRRSAKKRSQAGL